MTHRQPVEAPDGGWEIPPLTQADLDEEADLQDWLGEEKRQREVDGD